MKPYFYFLILFFSIKAFSQVNYYPITDINNTSPKIIKTSDGGFLINSYYSNYNDQGQPIEGSSRYRLIKTDVQGNEQWSLLNNNFSPFSTFENSDGSFVSLYNKFSSGSFSCGGVIYFFGVSAYFSKRSSDGTFINQIKFNGSCESSIRSVLQTDSDKYAVLARYYTSSGNDSDTHLFYVNDDGVISNDQTFSNEVYDSSHLFMDNSGNINVLYMNNSSIILKRFDANLNFISQDSYATFLNLFPSGASSFKLNCKQLANNNLSVFVTYNSTNTNSDNVAIINFDASLNYLNDTNYQMQNVTNRLFNMNDEHFKIAHKNPSETFIRFTEFDDSGAIIETRMLELPYPNEKPSHLAYNHTGEILIAGDVNCCNLDVATGPAFSFVSPESELLNRESFTTDYITVYPNPSTDFITVSGLTQITPYVIYNTTGQIIKEGTLFNEDKINVQDISNGLYFLKLEGKGVMKLIKNDL